MKTKRKCLMKVLSKTGTAGVEMTIISKIIFERHNNKWSRSELARLAGLKKRDVKQLESLKKPLRVEKLCALLYPLGYTLDVVPLRESSVPGYIK